MKRLDLSAARRGRKALWITFSLAAAIGLPGTGGSAAAADEKSTPAAAKAAANAAAGAAAPAEVVAPITPAKAEMADSAFKKLDISNKGYVTHDDVRGLDGFDRVFDLADPQRTGKLTLAQFKKAWQLYTGH